MKTILDQFEENIMNQKQPNVSIQKVNNKLVVKDSDRQSANASTGVGETITEAISNYLDEKEKK